MPAATESVRRGNTNELSPEDLEWTPSIRDEAAIAATLPSFMNDCRAQLTDTVPWTEEVWRLLLPRGRQFATRWRTRQPHEQISSAGQRRSTDRYLVNLKKHLLDQVFDRLSGCILEHLRSEDDESDPIKRAAIQRRRQGLADCGEKEKRAKLRADTGQWISNTVKKREGPRWLQAYEKAYQTAVSPNADLVVNNAGQSTAAGVDGEASTSFRAQQGRAYSAKELLAMSEHYKDEVTARAARLIVDSSEPGVDDTSIRYWRRAMEEVWDEAPEEEQERFSVQAAELSAQINRGYQQIDKVFHEIVLAARDLQAIDGAFGAVVIETRKWSQADRNWKAVRYVLTTIPSKSPRKLQSSWDFVAYDQKVTDWCDSRRAEVEQSSNGQGWHAGPSITSPSASHDIDSGRPQAVPLFQPSPTPSPPRRNAANNGISILERTQSATLHLSSSTSRVTSEVSSPAGATPISTIAITSTSTIQTSNYSALPSPSRSNDEILAPQYQDEATDRESDAAFLGSDVVRDVLDHEDINTLAELSRFDNVDLGMTETDQTLSQPAPHREHSSTTVAAPSIPHEVSPVSPVSVPSYPQAEEVSEADAEEPIRDAKSARFSKGSKKRKHDSDWARSMMELKKMKRMAEKGSAEAPGEVATSLPAVSTVETRPKRSRAAYAADAAKTTGSPKEDRQDRQIHTRNVRASVRHGSPRLLRSKFRAQAE